MAEVRLSAEQASVVAAWSLEGADFVPLAIHDRPLSYIFDRCHRDVLVVQGDSYVHIGPAGQVIDSLRPANEGLC